jgi:Flp pilus assembly protein TadG
MPPTATTVTRLRPAPGRGDDRGYSIVEAAITLPVVVLLTMLVVQYALLWHGRHVAQGAAAEGVRAGRGYLSSAAAGQARAERYLHALAPRLLTGSSVAATRDATTVDVHVRARVLRVIPFGSYEVQESARGPVERFVPPGAGG